jgi:hypothetical protein
LVAEYHVRPATDADAVVMAPRLRPDDVAEIYAASGRVPEVSLVDGINRSTEAWTGLVDDDVACMWGVGPLNLLAGRGCPWLLGTHLVEAHAGAFLRCSRLCLRQMFTTYESLENFVDARNRLSIRWLRWLGFTIAPAQPHGFLRLPFHHFSMRRPDV